MYKQWNGIQRLIATGVFAALTAHAQFGTFKYSVAEGVTPGLQPAHTGLWVSGDEVAESSANGRLRVRAAFDDLHEYTCFPIASSTYCATGAGFHDVYRLDMAQYSPWLRLYPVDYDSLLELEARKELTKNVTVENNGNTIIEHYIDTPAAIRNLIARGSLRFANEPSDQFLRTNETWARSEIASWPMEAAQLCDAGAGSQTDPLNPNPAIAAQLHEIEIQRVESPCRQAAADLPAHPRYSFLYGRVLQAAKRLPEAQAQFAKAADMGYPAAYLELGTLKIDSANPAESQAGFDLLMRAVRHDIPIACSMVGRAYAAGTGVPQDFVTALKFYEAGIRGGDGLALMFAGDAHYYGEGTPRSPEDAMALYTSAFSRRRYIYAVYMMGMVELYHRKNPIRALTYFEDAARGGYAPAQFQLGSYYYFDQQDPQTAFSYFEQAARSNDSKAQFMVGSQYLMGAGVPRNNSQGFYWLDQSSRQGWDLATITLGNLYEAGESTPRDVGAARGYYTKAAGSRDPKIRNEALTALQQLSSNQRAATMSQPSLGEIILGGAAILFGAWAVNKMLSPSEDSSASSTEKDEWLQKLEEDRRREEREQKDRERSECIQRGGYYGEVTGCAGQQW